MDAPETSVDLDGPGDDGLCEFTDWTRVASDMHFSDCFGSGVGDMETIIGHRTNAKLVLPSSKLQGSQQQLLQHRTKLQQNPVVSLKMLVTWNVGGAAVSQNHQVTLRHNNESIQLQLCTQAPPCRIGSSKRRCHVNSSRI